MYGFQRVPCGIFGLSRSFLRGCYVQEHAKSLQFCPTVCNPMECSPPGSSVPGILQTRMIEWVAMPFVLLVSGRSNQKMSEILPYSHFKQSSSTSVLFVHYTQMN